MGFEGYKYTWNNRRKGTQHVQVRLDKFFISTEGLGKWPNARVCHLFSHHSDHLPILMDLNGDRVKRGLPHQGKPFRFEQNVADTFGM